MTEPSREALEAARKWYGDPVKVHGDLRYPSYVIGLAHLFDAFAAAAEARARNAAIEECAND